MEWYHKGMSWQSDLLRDRDVMTTRGDELDAWLQGEIDRQGGVADEYRQRADAFYEDLMERGGYSPEEAARILQEEGLEGLGYTDQDAQDAFLTADEEQEVRGDPWAPKNAWDPSGMYEAAGSGAANRRGAWETGGGRAREAAGRLRGDLYGAIDPRIELAEGYGDRLEGIIGEGVAGQRGQYGRGEGLAEDIADPIRVSDRYLDAMDVSDEEVQGLENLAAQAVRGRNARIIQDVERRAAQGGNANALAVGALRQDLERDGGLSAAEAAVNARLQATGYRRGVEQERENTRLGAEEGRARFRSQGLDFVRDAAGVERDAMGARLGAAEGAEDRRYRGVAAGMGARMDAARTAGAADLQEAQMNRAGRQQIEDTIADRDFQLANYFTDRRVDLEQQGEANQQNRAAALAQNRQQTRQGNTANRFGQRMDLARFRSGAGAQVGDARRSDQQQGGQYMGGMNQFQQQQRQNNVGRRVDVYGTQGQLRNQANNTYAQARSQPGMWSRIFSGALGAAGSLFGGG